MTQDFKCAFSGPQMTGTFTCKRGRQVARRGGPDISCDYGTGHQRCAQLFESLKSAGLDHMALEDNLLTLPHSVLLKVQYGGLLGLQRLLGEAGETVADINGLVDQLLQKYDELDNIPVTEVSEDIATFKVARRRDRHK